ncbi:ribonuclease H [Trifolium pratense]|uniref:Ribonuclease H n=1 Tax=Trifolium pratense TaxID=57577 RepID=A0A2K3L066_TRIPR|nr:ribonuclease H [Trifolium pratense]
MVCKEKSKGGLGVRDVRIVNLSLLTKWRWRLLLPGRALWKDVLVAKYGRHILTNVDWSGVRIPTMASKWWRDICSLDKVVESKNWLVESMVRRLGNGNATYFWTSIWIGDVSISACFPRLFSLSNQKESMIIELCEYDGERWNWTFSWRRALFLWEEELAMRLRDLLATVNLLMEDDGWNWVPDPKGVFSVKSTYLHLVDELRSGELLEDGKAMIFYHIWDSPALSKVIAFSWQLLHDRISTRSNLAVAWIIIVIPPSLFSLFEVLRASTRNVKIRKGFLLIWHATIWSLWKARNGSIFANGSFAPHDIVEEIKVTSWKWSLARLKLSPCVAFVCFRLPACSVLFRVEFL